jgi:hypothetical protein
MGQQAHVCLAWQHAARGCERRAEPQASRDESTQSVRYLRHRTRYTPYASMELGFRANEANARDCDAQNHIKCSVLERAPVEVGVGRSVNRAT